MNKTQAWILASRPKTLPAAAAPVLVATLIALKDGVFQFWPALAALAGALLIQIGTNFVNDYFDFKKGTDTEERVGPVRVTQSGLLSPKEVIMGTWIVFGLAVLVGIYILIIGGWPIFVIGLLSILFGYAYTGGPYPLSYNGSADIFVFIFFGFVAVGGTYYIQAGTISPQIYWASIPIGLLATAILVVNNFRDIEQDRVAGKKTLAVRFGKKRTQLYYFLLLGLTYVVPVIMWLSGLVTYWILLVLLSLPLCFSLVKDILHKKGTALNETLAGTGKLELLYGILFSIGYLLS
ncbi:1,4-dihydroxy-2-naphthoate polyprenyltransferase [Tepidibacillus sp. HK-1]|uniref:1,4-dihydroxy-2-naphthoate polyprenyltransferase n=1 Tax=Tepidibacillus sp. HK-1 TaxID=1883407 RepID=UPI0008586E8B|nr:1,4-dihydroxy-2-naphthoate polyprenyltransferase [Tepidibacillus sp. HK-1]GBF11274.1 1,4-dihydroxy-2-naphthoate octaprenyltransferase [Tepidibacillus sp. HK-1]